jgi:HEAT repeat protein
MSRRSDLRDALSPLDEAGTIAYLTAHSGLPGPRGNLELLAAFGDVAPTDLILRLVGSDDEYLASCAAAAVGRVLVETSGEETGDLVGLLRDQARDDRWRVREGVAMALQRLGDAAPDRLRDLVRRWADDPEPLVQRAAIAGICEPRLLHDPLTAQCALDACRAATASLAALPAPERRRADVRTLRQGLGYCWSVAVAGDPATGLPAFAALREQTDADVQWVVRENLRKTRLQSLLQHS